MKEVKKTCYYCDICGNVIKTHSYDIHGAFHFRYFDKSDIRKVKRMDVCYNCRRKIVAIIKEINNGNKEY